MNTPIHGGVEGVGDGTASAVAAAASDTVSHYGYYNEGRAGGDEANLPTLISRILHRLHNHLFGAYYFTTASAAAAEPANVSGASMSSTPVQSPRPLPDALSILEDE